MQRQFHTNIHKEWLPLRVYDADSKELICLPHTLSFENQHAYGVRHTFLIMLRLIFQIYVYLMTPGARAVLVATRCKTAEILKGKSGRLQFVVGCGDNVQLEGGLRY